MRLALGITAAMMLAYFGRDGTRVSTGAALATSQIPSTAESFTSRIFVVPEPGIREIVIDFPECPEYYDSIWATWKVTSGSRIEASGTGRVNPKTCSTMRLGSVATIPRVAYYVKVDFHGTLAGRFKSDSTLTVK